MITNPFGSAPEGVLSDLHAYVSAMMAAGGASFLAVTRVASGDGLQMAPIPDGSGVELDFPLITEEQIALLPKIRAVGHELGLIAREAIGGDGDDFIDFDVLGDALAVSARISEFFIRLYGADASTPVTFEYDGFEPSA